MQFRVIGVLEAKGQFLGIDLDDTAYIPTARALELYNRDGLMKSTCPTRKASAGRAGVSALVKATLKARHGREDFTITTQEDMLRTLSNILDVLTMAVGALGSISLLVGGVGIVTIMTIAVTERTGEIGLLVALGAPRRTILGLFLGEAVALSALGGLLGLLARHRPRAADPPAGCRRCRCTRRSASWLILAEVHRHRHRPAGRRWRAAQRRLAAAHGPVRFWR
jgi:putative ABC transport system permease protein